MNIIKRKTYLKKIQKFIDTEEIKVITGLRRSGKTYFLKQIINKLKKKRNKKQQHNLPTLRISKIR